MQDRVPLYPGRVVLTPVSGQANTYDMTRADQPTQEGTPLNKATLLKDATAALYGLGTNAVPDEVLSAIKTLLDETAETANSKARVVAGSYVGTQTLTSGLSQLIDSNRQRISLPFTPKAVLVMYSGINFWYDNSPNRYYMALATKGNPAKVPDTYPYDADDEYLLEIMPNAFDAYTTRIGNNNTSDNYYYYLSMQGYVYNYVAIG